MNDSWLNINFSKFEASFRYISSQLQLLQFDDLVTNTIRQTIKKSEEFIRY